MTAAARPPSIASVHRRRAVLGGAAALLGAVLPGCAAGPIVTMLIGRELVDMAVSQLEEVLFKSLQKLAVAGGIEDDPALHIELPKGARLIVPLLQATGQHDTLAQIADLEHQFNRTAERMAGDAFPIYHRVIQAHDWLQQADTLRQQVRQPSDTLKLIAREELMPPLVALARTQAEDSGLAAQWQTLQTARERTEATRAIQTEDLHDYLAEQLTRCVLTQMDREHSTRPQPVTL